MYFTDLLNSEAELFHQIVTARDMSVSLTEMVTSDLFKIVDMSNDIYKIFPLFYCKKITTDNPDAKILENKCIITKSSNDEQYYHFISDNEEIVMFEDWNNILDIGDTITTDDFNAYVQLLRKYVTFTDNLIIKNGLTNGTYADYQFNLDNVSIVDNGILITEETLSSNPTVRLTDPIFKNSSYILKLDVFSVSDVNIYDGAYRDNIEHDTLTIPLITDTDVTIDLEELDFNKIILFNASVEILHNKTVLEFTKHLTMNITGITRVGETLTFTGLYDNSGTGIAGATLTFYDGDTSIGTATTQNDGSYIFTYQPDAAKEFYFNVKSEDEITASIPPVTVTKQVTNITLSSSKNTAFIPTTFTVAGVLTNSTLDTKMSGVGVKIYDNNTLIDTQTTDSNGTFTSNDITANTITTHNLRAVFEETSTIYGCNSSFVKVTARKLYTNLTINTTKNSFVYGENCIVSGVLSDEFGEKIPNAEIEFWDGASHFDETTTNSNGEYQFTYPCENIGEYNLRATFNGDATHSSNGVTAIKRITVNKIPTNINITAQSSYTAGSPILIYVASDYGSVPLGSVEVTCNGKTQTVNIYSQGSSGTFGPYKLPAVIEGDYNLKIKYYGETHYESSTFEKTIHIKPKYDPKVEILSNGDIKVTAKLKAFSDVVPNAKIDAIYISTNGGAYVRFDPGKYTNSDGYIIVSGYPFIHGNSYRLYAQIGEDEGDVIEYSP